MSDKIIFDTEYDEKAKDDVNVEKLREERDRYHRELQDLTRRLQASAGIVQHGLLKKITALEGYIQALGHQQKRQQQQQCLISKQCNCHILYSRCGKTCCVAEARARPVHCGQSSSHGNAVAVSSSTSRLRPSGQAAGVAVAESRVDIDYPRFFLGSSGRHPLKSSATGRNETGFRCGHCGLKNAIPEMSTSDQQSVRLSFPLSSSVSKRPSNASSRDNGPKELTDQQTGFDLTAASAAEQAASTASDKRAASTGFDLTATDRRVAITGFDLTAAAERTVSTGFDLTTTGKRTIAESSDVPFFLDGKAKRFSSISSDPVSLGTSLELSSLASSLSDNQELNLAANRQKEPVRSLSFNLADSLLFSFSSQSDSSQSDSVAVFPSLPDSKLAELSLLPASLNELSVANATVSIVDPNGRYRMDQPPEVPEEEAAAAAAENDVSVPTEERIRELAISFANDSATVTERIKRAALTRASHEANFKEELQRLQQTLALIASSGGSVSAASDASQSARLLQDIGCGLSRTAETLGAVQQECRLNFAFHLIHKYSEETRSEKERMCGELELLRQAVEDDQFYLDVDSSLNKYAKTTGDSSGVTGKAKFQALGRSVARTTSVTTLLQKLARERERRRRQQLRQEGADETESLAEEGCDAAATEADDSIDRGGPALSTHAAAAAVDEQTVLDKLDRFSVRLFADRRIRLFLAPLTMIIAVVCLLWAVAYPIVKQLAV